MLCLVRTRVFKIYYSSCGFNNPRPKQILYRHYFCIFIGQTALWEKNVDVTNLTKQHRLSDLDYQLRKVEVNPIQAASGNWLDRNPENVKLSECHISLQVTMVKYVLRLKKDFVTIFSCSTALEIVAKGFGAAFIPNWYCQLLVHPIFQFSET